MDIPFVVCVIIAMVLFYQPFFGAEKDFLACLDAFLASDRRLGWLNGNQQKNDGKTLKMTLFLASVFLSSLFVRIIIVPIFQGPGF